METYTLLHRDLKDKGHRLIDELVAFGVSKNKLYQELTKHTGLTAKQKMFHFKEVNELEMLKKAVKYLESRLEQKKNPKESRPQRTVYAQNYQRELRRVQRRNNIRRVIHTIRDKFKKLLW